MICQGNGYSVNECLDLLVKNCSSFGVDLKLDNYSFNPKKCSELDAQSQYTCKITAKDNEGYSYSINIYMKPFTCCQSFIGDTKFELWPFCNSYFTKYYAKVDITDKKSGIIKILFG